MSKFKCSHCQLVFDENSAITNDSGQKFCCSGCKNVYELLHESGFDEFYSRLGKSTLSPQNSLNITKQSVQSLYKEFVKSEDGFNKINLVIEGIHCSACIWLNEKVLHSMPGVIEASVNATNNKATVIWDEELIGLDEILAGLNAVGYRAYAYDISREEERMASKRREFYMKLLVGIFCVMNIMWIAVSQYAGYFSGIDASVRDILNFAEFLLATPVLFYTGSAFFSGAKIALKTKTPNMDLLVITGASLAYVYSIYAMFSRTGEVYFDSVAMIITFVFVGKFLEILSKKRASDTIDGLNLLTLSEVCVLNGENLEQKNARDVVAGETIVLKAGDKVLIDGIIKSGEASFDLSSLNGESIPVVLAKDESVKSGSICLDGLVYYTASANFESSLLSKIIAMLENATLKKPKIEQFANEISPKFSLIVLGIALATFFYYLSTTSFQNALIIAISVIVIACPCALALATPVATLCALGVGLKKGVIFKEAKFIESLAKCDTVVFDKTGTLTNSALVVSEFVKFKEFDDGVILALANASSHPVSMAVAKFLCKNQPVVLTNAKEFMAKGVSASLDDKILLGGSARFMRENQVSCDSDDAQYFVAFNGELVAKFILKDELRQGAKECVDTLKSLGIRSLILSGDTQQNVKKVADELGIEFWAGVLPDEKAEFISELVLNSHQVAFVGDGINDSIAMSLAQIGVCMRGGADVSLERSDVALLNNDLAAFTSAMKLSRATLRKIKQNLFFSLCYNAFTLPLAVMGFIIPLFAAISMSLSSLVVVLNSLALRREFKEKNG
ncbi:MULTISPECIES: heavy metal translocating P-type ATPase [unclassified Campylobacter]|uniref:heavy metal translocating P-type ATPase n=1 Tax=unclassified Campylobacter TaxID=2593542 RepID=UPI003D33C360